MDPRARAWLDVQSRRAATPSPEQLVALKRGHRISVVIPARNEEETIAEVVRMIRHDLVDTVPLVDELVVMDSLSTDATAAVAAKAGATLFDVRDVVPELGTYPGKGEALWKSLFVTTGELLVFIDADLTEWDTHFVTGLLGPLLTEDATLLVKGFYDRVLDMGTGASMEGGRVTELVARPLFALHWPQLSALAQPLAGEWAVRRSLFESLPVPVGYGVELAAVLDTVNLHGVNAIAQVDLGRRAHRHQNLHDLGVMATELLRVANRRIGLQNSEVITLPRMGRDRSWIDVSVPSDERPPAANTRGYPAED